MARERIAELMRVAPPADLDALVQHRARAALRSALRSAEARAATTSQVDSGSAPAIPLPWAERCVYAVGLAAYAGQAAWEAARSFWRVLVG